MRGRPPENPSRQLPNRIREWRQARKMSIVQLAEAMQSNYQTVARHETGGNDMTLARLERYAEVLAVKVEELLSDSHRVPADLKELMELAQTLSREDQKRLLRLGASLKEPDAASPNVTPLRVANHTN